MRETLNEWSFVLAAYGVGGVGTLWLAGWSWLRMQAAERRRDGVRHGR